MRWGCGDFSPKQQRLFELVICVYKGKGSGPVPWDQLANTAKFSGISHAIFLTLWTTQTCRQMHFTKSKANARPN